jgi:asparagine synthase (glutamine-hydrolysing)
MCGICGLLERDTPDLDAVERMTAAMVHRGPDHGAVAAEGRCALGYRRLSIVDLATGEQPVANERGDVLAVFNGELYNFRELRRELEAKGHEIRGTGDSPLIPHAYEEWGLGFAERIEGMFAIALWDAGRERLVLLRDRLGKKPLRYAQLPGGALAFASETKALLELPEVSRELDLAQIDAFLALQYAPRSGFRAIEQVPPGSYAVAERGAPLKIERYWRPEPGDTVSQGSDWHALVREEVSAAVRRRLVADVPLGALLSGGIDSSIVVAVMAQASAEPVRTFTVGFPDRRYDERAYAREVAQRWGTRHEELEVDPTPDLLPRLAAVLDEPFGDEAALPQLLVCEATRRHVKVALVGDGGDEVFGGYDRYRAHALAARVPAPLARAALAAPWGRREPRSASFRARRFLAAAATPARERYAGLMEIFPLELRRRLWTNEALAEQASAFLPANDDLRLVDVESYLPGDLLVKSDLASMAASLELRSPFLDHRVVELGLALPRDVAFGKVALKQAFAADLSPQIATRAKTGFGVPLDRWFRGELRDTATDLLLARDRGLFSRAELERLLREHVDGRADHGHRLWCLCMLELWQRTYVDARRTARAAA